MLSNGVSSWRCGSRGAFDEVVVFLSKGFFQGNRDSLDSSVAVCAMYLHEVEGVFDQLL